VLDHNTNFGWFIFLDKKDTAAIFVANGQGLIEVSIPSHKADMQTSIISNIDFYSFK